MIGDARHLPLEDNSVNCIITSPPYWSLRKYDIPDLIWDEDTNRRSRGLPSIEYKESEGQKVCRSPVCKHEWGNQRLVDGHVYWRGYYEGDCPCCQLITEKTELESEISELNGEIDRLNAEE